MNLEKSAALTVAVALVVMLGSAALAAGGGAVLVDPGAMEGKHFDPKGKPPSKFTIELQNGLRKTLPFDDKRDFEEAKRGFVAAPGYKQIMADAGHVAWDMIFKNGSLVDQFVGAMPKEMLLQKLRPHI